MTHPKKDGGIPISDLVHPINIRPRRPSRPSRPTARPIAPALPAAPSDNPLFDERGNSHTSTAGSSSASRSNNKRKRNEGKKKEAIAKARADAANRLYVRTKKPDGTTMTANEQLEQLELDILCLEAVDKFYNERSKNKDKPDLTKKYNFAIHEYKTKEGKRIPLNLGKKEFDENVTRFRKYINGSKRNKLKKSR